MKARRRPGLLLAPLLPLLLLPVLFSVFLSGCSELFSGPKRPRKDGYRAHAILEEGGKRTELELAVRGADRRVERPDRKEWPVLVVKGDEKRAFELDPATKRWRKADFAALSDVLAGHPLGTGFSDREEAKRRGLERYARESDAIFAGNACQLWRFDDDPDAVVSASSTYWVVPVLDSLVVRKDDEKPLADGTKEKRSTELRNVRPGADPSLFAVPSGWIEATEAGR